MKFSQASLLAACLPAVSSRFLEVQEVDNVVLNPEETFLIELAPGETQWVTEEDKWELRRVSRAHHASRSLQHQFRYTAGVWLLTAVF